MIEKILFVLIFKWKYRIAAFKAWLLFEKPPKAIKSITYVAREADKKWIFGAQVRRLSNYSRLNSQPYFHAKLRDIPQSDAYFFIFPNYFCRAMRHNPFLLNRKNIVMYTHAHWTRSYSKTHIAWCLNKAHKVICLNSTTKKQLVEIGVNIEKIEILHIAACPETFYEHERKDGRIGFCAAYSERKNPNLIFDLVKNMPEKKFTLIGKNWKNYERFEELIRFPNFTYCDNPPYETYPKLYSEIDFFVSASLLEGGPVPVLEAMLSNCVPIASRTGFCPDIIQHGENGFLFEPDAHFKDVMKLITEAADLKTNTRASVLAHSWKNCSKKIDALCN